MADARVFHWLRSLAIPHWLLLALAAGLLCFMHLRAPLQEPQEARYAEIPRQMLAEGSWLTPILHGQPYYDKPPLFYWLVMASYSVCGVHDWAARWLACALAWGCILVAYAWGRAVLPARAALLGGLMLCLSPRFLQLDRMVTMDGLLCLCVTAAWASAHRALRGPQLHRGWWLLSALATGLGLLTKGPIALVLFVPPVLALRWLDPSATRPSWRALALYLTAALATAAPWFIALAVRDPDFLHYFFWLHHVQRYVEPFDHEEPFWYYLPGLLGGMLPWTLLLPGLAWRMAKSRHDTGAQPLRLLVACSFWCLLFFSLSGCKRAFYILPAMPPLALALGGYLDALMPAGGFWRWRSQPAFLVWLVTWLTGLGALVTATVSGLLSVPTGSVLATAAALAGSGVLIWLRSGRQATWGLCFVTNFLLVAVLLHQLLPTYANRFALRGLVRGHTGTAVPVFCYPRRWDSIGYYLQRGDVRVFAAEQLPELLTELRRTPEALVFLKAGKPGASPSAEVLQHLPSTLVFEPCGRQGHLTVGKVVRRVPRSETAE